MKITINVDLEAEVPDATTDDELEAITLKLPIAAIDIVGFSDKIPGSRVTGYCTQRIDKDPT